MAKLPDGVLYHRDDFIIDQKKQAEIDEAVATARKNWRRLDDLDMAYPADQPAFLNFSEQVRLPFDYRLAISFEDQPGQPGWFQRSPKYVRVCHISLSIDGKPGYLAPPAVLAKVMRACRHVDDPPDRVWVTDFVSRGGLMGYAVRAVWLAT